tara:strand:+ start:429 stop:593 length:165 start_codon:yes stop_codon:yes gene_type:complete
MIKLLLVYFFFFGLIYLFQKIIFSKIINKHRYSSNNKDNVDKTDIIDVDYEEVE